MSAEKGSAFLLKVGDGGAPPVFATVAGMRTTQLSVNGEAVNVTSKDSGGWRQLLSGAGVRSVSVSGSGIFTGSAAETRIKTNALAGLIDDYELSFESGERLQGVSAAAPPELAASPGRAVGEPDLPHGPTIVRLYDLPLGDGQGGKPQLFVAAAGAEAGWRRAALSASYDHGESWQAAGGTAAAAIFGTTLDTLPAAGSALFDRVSALDVELAGESMWLESRTDDALVDGANLAAVGDELIQFGDAEPLGVRRFRLSRLLRGRRGTEWAAGGHATDEAFTLIEPGSLAVLEAPAGSLGGEARIMAVGIGDLPEAAVASAPIEGASLQPPSPVHLTARANDTGDLDISWVRRSRQGWPWVSGSDTPLGEEAERYRLVITGTSLARTVEPDTPAYLYTAAERAEDGTGPIQISVSQAGTFAASRAATLAIE